MVSSIIGHHCRVLEQCKEKELTFVAEEGGGRRWSVTCARGDLGVDQGIKLLIQHPWVSGLLRQQTLLEVRVRLVPV